MAVTPEGKGGGGGYSTVDADVDRPKILLVLARGSTLHLAVSLSPLVDTSLDGSEEMGGGEGQIPTRGHTLLYSR
jgi:hypothetical protein